jgi:hypothetical protein
MFPTPALLHLKLGLILSLASQVHIFFHLNHFQWSQFPTFVSVFVAWVLYCKSLISDIPWLRLEHIIMFSLKLLYCHVLVTRHMFLIGYWIYWMLITRNFKQLWHFHRSMQSTNNCSSFQVLSACYVFTYMLLGSGFQQCGFSILLPRSTAPSWWLKWCWVLPAESFLVWDPTGPMTIFYCFLARDWLVCLSGKLLLALASTVGLGFKPHGAHDGLGWSSRCLAKDISTIVAFRHYITTCFSTGLPSSDH